jgi:predicted nuclease with RNAse H fold
LKFIGIDVHLHSVVVAVIDENLNIIEVSNVSFEETINKVEAYLPTIISIDAPSSLNKGLMNDEEYRKNIGRKINGHYNKKVSEYELSRRGINPFPTPDTIEKVRSRNDLSWMEKGFLLFNNLIDKGYMILNQNNLMESMEKGIVEVFPHASFSTLAGQLLQNKNTDEGLNQRWLLLQQLGFNNLDFIMKDVKRKDKDDYLDALAAAYTGYAISIGKGSFIGDAIEGQIALPIRDIKESYKRSNLYESESFPND